MPTITWFIVEHPNLKCFTTVKGKEAAGALAHKLMVKTGRNVWFGSTKGTVHYVQTCIFKSETMRYDGNIIEMSQSIDPLEVSPDELLGFN